MAIAFQSQNDRFCFFSDSLMVEFSQPHIQPFDEYGYVKSDKAIMYYYYSVRGFVNEEGKWEKLFELRTFDFPCILDFKAILELFIQNKFNKQHYQAHKHGFGVVYSYAVNSGFMGEDTYSVTHECMVDDDGKEKNRYHVFAGKGLGGYCSNTIGVNMRNLTHEELCTIYECVQAFVSYTINITNDLIVSRNKQSLESLKYCEGKLYEYGEDGKSITGVFAVGDTIDSATLLVGDINSQDFSSRHINNFVIEAITPEHIQLSCGYEEPSRGSDVRKVTTTEYISLENLLALFNEVSEEQLKFDEAQIADEFYDILTENEKLLFANGDAQELFDIWKDAIIARTWMCRSEHCLPQRVEDTGHHENVYESVKYILAMIIAKSRDELSRK